MGSLKDQLQKFRGMFGAKPKKQGGNHSADAAKSSPLTEDESWKKGVEPIQRRQDRVTPATGLSKPKPHARANQNPSKKKTGQKQHPKKNKKKKWQRRGGPAAARMPPVNKTPAIKKPSAVSIKFPPPPAPPQIPLPDRRMESPPEARLSRLENFHEPADWVGAGRFLQTTGSTGGRVLPIQVGIDFGTAYTKLAVNVADSIHVVPFEGLCGGVGEPFLLPGELSLSRDFGALVGRSPKAEQVATGLKVPFVATKDTSLDGKINASLFLAWVMRYARAWIYRELASLIQGRTLAWNVNVGIPSNSWADRGLNQRYESVLLAAWTLSQRGERFSPEDARHLLLAERPSPGAIGLDDLRLVPEFVAQMAGYVLSPQRPGKGDELHLLVDIGAGTVDIACFGAYKAEREDFYQFPTWASAVEPMGTHFLMAARQSVHSERQAQWDDVSGVPSTSDYASLMSCSLPKVTEIDNEFSNKVSAAIGKVLLETRKRRNPLAPEWQGGIRTFLAGGGSSCEVYKQATKRALARLRTPIKEIGFQLDRLVDRQRLQPELKHRLSVAYGLTFDAETIGDALPAENIEDFTGQEQTANRPDRDELYGK